MKPWQPIFLLPSQAFETFTEQFEEPAPSEECVTPVFDFAVEKMKWEEFLEKCYTMRKMKWEEFREEFLEKCYTMRSEEYARLKAM